MKTRFFIFLGSMIIFLAACGGMATIEPPVATEVTQAPLPSPQVSPTPQPRTLTVCAGSEPSELFLYNELTYIKGVILSTLYDGPIDQVNYGYQPVILEKLPSLADGDAVIEMVQAKEGDLVVDNSGTLTVLQPGVVVRPAGCRSSDCAAAYASGPFEMDHMRVDFHIKKGVQWSDSQPLLAADSVFSYQLATNPDVLYGNNGLVSGSAESVSFTASYTALDDYTTEWIGLPGFFDPNYQTNFFSPLPLHQLSAYAVPQLLEANEVLYSPLGWGPYRVTSWEPGVQMTLEPNPYYYRAAEGLPFFTTVYIRFLGKDEQGNPVNPGAGLCDILLQDAVPEFPTPTLAGQINGGVARYTLDPQPVTENLIFNLSPADPTQPAFFSDVRMRRALAACVDRSALMAATYASIVPPLDQVLPLDSPLMNGANLASYPFNLSEGMAQLESLGWSDTDGDGIREAHGSPGVPDGTLLRFNLVTTDTPLRSQIGALVSAQLKACGMDVTLVQAPTRDLLAQNADAPLSGRRFDLAEFSSPLGVEGVCALMESSQISSQANGWSGSNLDGYSDPFLDDICARVRASLPGTDDYITSRQSALQVFAEHLPYLPLFEYTRFTLARTDLAGLMTGFGEASELQNIESFRWGP